MKHRGLGVPGRPRGRVPWLLRAIGTAAACAAVVLGTHSCSEIEEPLNWQAANRPGLGASLDTCIADTLVVADAAYTPTVLSGGGLYLLVGHVVRQDPMVGELVSQAYLRWDVSELPAGDLTEARIDFTLRDVQDAEPADPDSFVLEASEVAGAWIEDSLGVAPFPAVGAPIAGGLGVVQVSGVTDTSDVLVPGVFQGTGLRDLVASWRDDEAANLGLVIGPAPGETQEGFLRFISSEGRPRGTVDSSNTPLLRVKIVADGGDTTTISLEPAADGFVVSARHPVSGDPIVTPDSLLLLSSGHVQGLLFALDLPALMASDPVRFPIGLVIHQATLHLTAVRGTDWSLAPDDSLTILVHQTSTVWSEDQVPTAIMLDETISSGEFFEDDEVVLDVHEAVQQMVEGADVSLALTCSAATSRFRSLLCQSRHALQGRPELRIVFSKPVAGRLNAEQGGK